MSLKLLKVYLYKENYLKMICIETLIFGLFCCCFGLVLCICVHLFWLVLFFLNFSTNSLPYNFLYLIHRSEDEECYHRVMKKYEGRKSPSETFKFPYFHICNEDIEDDFLSSKYIRSQLFSQQLAKIQNLLKGLSYLGTTFLIDRGSEGTRNPC